MASTLWEATWAAWSTARSVPSRMAKPIPMPAPWRIEAKATPFSAWIIVEPTVHRLERAISHADELKRVWRYYATRIRAN